LGRSPSDVVKAAYGLAIQGRYSETDKYMSSDLRTSLNQLGAETLDKSELGPLTQRVMMGWWQDKTREGTLERVEIDSEETRGELSELKLHLHYKDGVTQLHTESLLKENGGWKLMYVGEEIENKVKLASVKINLRDLMTAQEAYFSDYATYAADYSALQAKTNALLSLGNSASVAGVASGYTATVSNSFITAGSTTCQVQVGAGASSTIDGVIICR
jgi:hypothetical protein